MDIARPGTFILAGIAALGVSAGVAGASGAAAPDSVIGRATAAVTDTVTRVTTGGGLHGADLLSAAAAYVGITVDQLRTEMGTDKSLAEVAVAHGKTRDGLIAALQQAQRTGLEAFVDRKGAAKPDMRPGMHFGRGAAGVDVVAASATYLGTTADDVRAKLAAGETLAQIAAATPGKSRDGLVQALVADATAKIDAAQQAGSITADRATQAKSGLAAEMARVVDATRPAGPPDRGPRGRR